MSHSQQLQSKVAEQLAEQHLADDDRGQTDHDGAAAHVDIRKALVLGSAGAPDRATRPLEIISPSTMFMLVLMPCARDICRFAPVARMEEPSSVPKNQYRMATIASHEQPHNENGMHIERFRALAHFLQVTQRNQQGAAYSR